MFDKYYVYTHTTSDGRMIYCGIGIEGRAWEQKHRDPYHKQMIKSFDHNYVELVKTGLSKGEALCEERKIIREEDPLCNIQERIVRLTPRRRQNGI